MMGTSKVIPTDVIVVHLLLLLLNMVILFVVDNVLNPSNDGPVRVQPPHRSSLLFLLRRAI